MDTDHYVNLPADGRSDREEQRENCHSGGLKIFRLVGISFGLLCVMQAALNVSLRLQAVGRSDWSNNVSSINFTVTSADDIRDLILERNQLLRDKDQLVREKKRLQFQNRHLTDDKKTLNGKVAEQQNQIRELETKAQSCPQGWWRYMSSCYLASSKRDTWENARRDCVRHGAHLVIFDYETEERIARIFGSILWMGLRSQFDESTRRWTWTWVDGSRPVYTNWNNDPPPRRNDCAYVDATSPWTNPWFRGACDGQLYWMCEMELYRT